MTREQQVLVDELEHEIDANLARHSGRCDEPCHFSLVVPSLQMTIRMRRILAQRYENAGWSRVWFEEVSSDELGFVLEPSTRQSQVRLTGSWFGRSGPPPPPPPRWHQWIHQVVPLVLMIAVAVLWLVAWSYIGEIP